MNLPKSWHRMGWSAKASYLCQTHQAKDYSDACAKLRAMRSPAKKPTPLQAAVASKTFWWQE